MVCVGVADLYSNRAIGLLYKNRYRFCNEGPDSGQKLSLYKLLQLLWRKRKKSIDRYKMLNFVNQGPFCGRPQPWPGLEWQWLLPLATPPLCRGRPAGDSCTPSLGVTWGRGRGRRSKVRLFCFQDCWTPIYLYGYIYMNGIVLLFQSFYEHSK